MSLDFLIANKWSIVKVLSIYMFWGFRIRKLTWGQISLKTYKCNKCKTDKKEGDSIQTHYRVVLHHKQVTIKARKEKTLQRALQPSSHHMNENSNLKKAPFIPQHYIATITEDKSYYLNEHSFDHKNRT